MKKKNLRETQIKSHDVVSTDVHPPWYAQLIRLDESKHEAAVKTALDKIKKSKPDAFKFIEDNKCELIGFIPNVSYAMPNNSEDSLGVTFVHDFSQSTLLYWCKGGGFAFFINASLKYNDGVRGLTY